MTGTVCPVAVCEPMYVCERVDGRLAAFRLDRYLEQAGAVASGEGLTQPTAQGVVAGLHRQLRAWPHPVGAGASGLYLRYVGGSRVTALASAAGGQLADRFRPRTLQVTADPEPGPIDPAGWDGQSTVTADGEVGLPRGVHLFLRYRDRLVAVADEKREPTATSSALLSLAADAGLCTVHGEIMADGLRADCDSGAITEALVTTVPPVILSVGSIRFGASQWTVGTGQPGPTAIRACRRLTAICRGSTRDPHGWMTLLPRPAGDGADGPARTPGEYRPVDSRPVHRGGGPQRAGTASERPHPTASEERH